jgi:hypothetical protein
MTEIKLYGESIPSPLHEQLIELLHHNFADELSLVARLTEDEREAIGTASHWSAKDIIAHVMGWKQRTTHMLALAARGQTPPAYDNEAELNTETFEHFRLMPWNALLEDAESAVDDLVTQVERFADEDLLQPDRFGWRNGRPLWQSIAGNGYEHPQEHLAHFYVARGDRLRADQMQERLASVRRALDETPHGRGASYYNLACYYALSERPQRALDLLRQAFALRPDLIAFSRSDTDLASLQVLPEYEALVKGS